MKPMEVAYEELVGIRVSREDIPNSEQADLVHILYQFLICPLVGIRRKGGDILVEETQDHGDYLPVPFPVSTYSYQS